MTHYNPGIAWSVRVKLSWLAPSVPRKQHTADSLDINEWIYTSVKENISQKHIKCEAKVLLTN